MTAAFRAPVTRNVDGASDKDCIPAAVLLWNAAEQLRRRMINGSRTSAILNLLHRRTVRQRIGSEKTGPLRAALETGGQFAGFEIDPIDVANVAIVAIIDLLLAIVLDLHDLVPGRKGPPETLDLVLLGGIQRQLQFDVQRASAKPPGPAPTMISSLSLSCR
jgi:hypothetical protein